MNPDELWKKLKKKNNLELAFNYALYDRQNSDHFYNPLEIHYAKEHKEEIIEEITEDLKDPDAYEPQNAYSYYPPKNNLCYRRMIHLPIKDLVIRYALITIIADQVDIDFHDKCFANRRETGPSKSKRLLSDFANTSWPKFCLWQEKCLNDNYNILLRTDISAFYDSISHDYLLNSVSSSIGVPNGSKIIELLNKHLKLNVISYSYVNFSPKKPRKMKQGLTIGSTCDSFLANIYLSEMDMKLSKLPSIKYGRYNDDMRIFGKDREEVFRAMQIIQEYLLERGLNLNSSKTEIAQGEDEIHQLQSKLVNISGYETPVWEINKNYKTQNGKPLEDHIDKKFDELEKEFGEDGDWEKDKDPKAFCKFLSFKNDKDKYKLSLRDREKKHIDTLFEIMKKYKSATRHSSWLLVQTAFYSGVKNSVTEHARNILMKCLKDKQVSSYGKYRILHHLVKKRFSKKHGEFRFINNFNEEQGKILEELLSRLIKEPAFELNIIIIYSLVILEKKFNEIYDFVKTNMNKPIGDPIKNLLDLLRDKIKPADISELEPLEEPDSLSEQY